MKPANPNQQTGLMTSIQNTLAEIEKSKVPEFTAGPDAIDAWVEQPESIQVFMGFMKTAVKDQVIYTKAMSDCCAIVLCTNYDERKGIFKERSLMHVPGSYLGGKDETEASLELVQMASKSEGKPKCIIVLGSFSTISAYESISNQEVPKGDGSPCKPFNELQKLCDFTIIEKTNDIAIRPDGTYVVRRWSL